MCTIYSPMDTWNSTSLPQGLCKLSMGYHMPMGYAGYLRATKGYLIQQSQNTMTTRCITKEKYSLQEIKSEYNFTARYENLCFAPFMSLSLSLYFHTIVAMISPYPNP